MVVSAPSLASLSSPCPFPSWSTALLPSTRTDFGGTRSQFLKYTNASMKVEQKKKEHIKKMAADRRMAQKFFLIQVELQFFFFTFSFFRQWSRQQQQQLVLLQSETDNRQNQQIPSASGMYLYLFATRARLKCVKSRCCMK